ncbi:MAG: hypothetical protein V9G29_15710 [Burkholderiaceae bacterium]
MKKHPVLNAAKLASAWVMAGAALLPLSALPAAAQQYKVVGAGWQGDLHRSTARWQPEIESRISRQRARH